MNIKKIIIALSLFLGCLFCVFPSFSSEPSIKEMNALLAEEKRELEILKRKIKKRGKKLSFVKAEEKSILNTMSQLKHNAKLKERELEIYKWNIKINMLMRLLVR